MKFIKSITSEAWLTAALALLGALGVVLMPQLVAAPKVLFGRSLTAIPPSLFPMIVLGTLAVLSFALLYSLRNSLVSQQMRIFEEGSLRRVVLLFAVMFFYALAMGPLGFFISSALSLTAVGWLAGNRSIIQILLVAVISPIALYLVATRGLAVSLPELSAIEFLYARVIDSFAAAPDAGAVSE